ncbi:MAG: hypothetical protein HON90_09695 [Halobacteriovoraceae bacterium]|nr:hypothetical protein [Halobacteriovoraceae bacterium]
MIDGKVLGKVLWWSEKDENGVICDPLGNEYYFDRSVLTIKKRQKLDRNSLVTFISSKCGEVLVAKEVSIPVSKSVPKFRRKFEEQRVQLALPLDF